MQTSPSIWVLADDRPGHRHQAIGVAQALGFSYALKPLAYTAAAKLPNLIKGASLLGISPQTKAELTPPWPDIVIAAGRRTAPVVRYIKKQSGERTFAVQLMWPDMPAHGFDLIAVPEHDGIAASERIILTTGAPHHLTQAGLRAAAEAWAERFTPYAAPRVAVLVGSITPGQAVELGTWAARLGGSLLVTTSRRTPVESAARLKATLPEVHYWYDPASGGENPYQALLASADAIVVTGDSVSMCSEACFTGKPVYLYAPDGMVATKHRKFLDAVLAQGYAYPLTKGTKPENHAGKRLDEAIRVAQEIRHRLGE